MITKSKKQLAFIFDDLTEFYAARELIDALRKESIPTDIIIPSNSGYNGLAGHTFKKINSLGYKPLKHVPNNKIYKVLFTPYPMSEYIRKNNYIYQIRLPYSTISAKPNPVYNTNFKIDYDAIICFNNYEPTFLSCYGADCYAVPYWKYYNFKKSSNRSGKPTLLILPTFGQDTSCVSYLTKSIIDDIKKHFKVIIKAHHAIHFGKDGENALQKLQYLADEFYDSDTPITELLKKADIVLSDNSGSIFEAIYANTPIVTFSKDLNARHLGNIDTLQYQLMDRGILPHTDNPKKILPLLLSVEPYYKKQQKIKKELFPTVTKNAVSVSVEIIKQYLDRDESKDYKKTLHDIMVTEWYKDKATLATLEERANYLESDNNSLKSIIEEQNTIFNSGTYRLYEKLITPYKKLKNLRSKNGK